MRAVSVTEIARSFSEYLNRVAFRGEQFVLTRGNKEIAELRPRRRGIMLREFAAGLDAGPHLTPEEAGAFRQDLEESRSRAAEIPVRDPWTTP